jgi:putative mRNA 3-end processing factor
VSELLTSTASGLYCADGDFFVDAWAPVNRAIITHAHGDHARPGCQRYLTSSDGQHVLRARLGSDAVIETLDYGEQLSLGGVKVSLHPAGHILGSAQVRIERADEVWVVSGDYKLAPDATCRPFETIACHTFVTESTFGLPIYRWPQPQRVCDEINQWWRINSAQGQASVIYAYSLGKAQRVLSGLDPTIGPIHCHGAVERMNAVYRHQGIDLPPTRPTVGADARQDWAGALIVAPPWARGTSWLRRFGDFASAMASGWMQIRGMRRRRTIERGFVLSDHADWPGLNEAIRATGAERVLVTHGSVGPMVRWLCDEGWQAAPLHTEFEGELDELAEPDAPREEEAGR